MLRWINVLKCAVKGNPKADREVIKTDAEWKAQLTPEQYRVTRLHGTEPAFSSEMCERIEPGKYQCVCCGTPLFDSGEKFDSGTGWPSFTQPIVENAIAYQKDASHGRDRIETLCNSCGAHLGHVFPDGPGPSQLRYCINAVALDRIESNHAKITLGGGCFWCTEALFQNLRGVLNVESGYSGGDVCNPTYREVCSGRTGHAEVIQITYDPKEIGYEDLVRVHLGTHNPSLLNQQGADKGTQYRSILFFRTAEEEGIAMNVISELSQSLGQAILTTVEPFEAFYPAEVEHQNYYRRNEGKPYCENVIDPKLAEFRRSFTSLLQTPATPSKEI